MFTLQDRAEAHGWRAGQCMTSFNGEKVFVIGGKSEDFTTLSSVSRYSLIKDQWEAETPKL